jgi:hypothetical protein
MDQWPEFQRRTITLGTEQRVAVPILPLLSTLSHLHLTRSDTSGFLAAISLLTM